MKDTGKVVSIDASAKQRGAATSSQRRRPASRQAKRPSKTALVLGGGGFTGAVYEIGALRALDLLSVNRSINDFDVYVGTSAGSFVAAMTANGVTPEEMMRVLDHQAPTPFHEMELSTLLRLNVREIATKTALLPWRLAQLGRSFVQHFGQVSALDVVLKMAEGLPSGLYSGKGIESYMREILDDPERTDDFRKLERELYITATDLDSCERVVFGSKEFDDIPISKAVRASTALPMVYEPVRIGDRDLIDGGILSTTNLDVAVEAGAKLVIVVNPLVPYVNEARKVDPHNAPRVSDMGFSQIGYQTFKLMTYRRLHEIRTMWEDRYPGVDFILIEPDATDELMFHTSIMDYTSRVRIASHGFRSVTAKLADDYPRLKQVAARHGIEISATRVRKVVKHFAVEPEQTARWRKILEQTTGALVRESASD